MPQMFFPLCRVCCLLSLLVLAAVRAGGQTLEFENDVRSFATLTNTTVTLTGRAELRLTGTGDPMPGCVVHLNSPEAWLKFTSVLPSVVASTYLSRVRVNGAPAVRNENVRVVAYAMGAVVIPQAADVAPLEIFDGRYFTGKSKLLTPYTAYNAASLGTLSAAIGSFKLKRGFTATLAANENGTGASRNYVAQDGDLEVGLLPAALENTTKFIRVFPWRWTAKKGVAGNQPAGPMKAPWWYNWSLDQNSSLDREYVAIRQNRWWPGLGENWEARGINHLLGFNEPDHTDQANMTVAEAISTWPELLGTGLRVGSPAPSDGGLSWLYSFMDQASAASLRVDYVAVHYYRSYWNAGDPAGAATQFYNFLKGIHDRVDKPIWITEWNNGANWTGDPDPTFAQQDATVGKIIEMLDNTPFVERYAIYNWVEDVRRVVWDDNWPTDAGFTYRDKVSPLAYTQAMADAGTGSSARYSFDGDSHDTWGNGQDAMLVGTPAYAPGRYGQAISLDGTDDYLQVSPRLCDSTDFTFAGWVNWAGGGNWQRVFDAGDDSTHYIYVCPKTAGGNLRFAINTGGGEQILSAPALTPGVWTHVAVTLSGNTGKLFVNGALAATNTAMTQNPVDVGTTYNYIGKSRIAADPLFGGRLDDLRFVSSALTDAQVAAIATTPPPQFLSRELWRPNATVGQAYASTLATSVTGGAAPLTFSKMDGAAWLTVAANGALGGTPTAADTGANNALVRVTDANGSIHTAMVQITVPPVTSTIATGNDDAEESAAGVVNFTSTDLELTNDGALGNQVVGLRFAGLAVPQGAVITDATIQFTTDEAQSEATVLSIAAEAADDAPAFAATTGNLSTRAVTSPAVLWQPAPWTTVGEAAAAQRTPNLAGILQKVVSRPGWASGNAVVILISGTGHRTAESYNLAGGTPPKLSVSFSTPSPLVTLTAGVVDSASDAEQSAAGAVSLTSTDLELVNDGTLGNQVIGVRFESLPLPRGAVIASAAIQFSADEAQSEATSLTIRAQAADSAPVFTTSVNDISIRPLTTATAAWAPAPWATLDERGPLQRTPDLAALVQEVASRPGWAPGNAMAFVLFGTGHRTADAADKPGGIPAALTVSYWPELPATSYARWTTTHAVPAQPTADTDQDGQPNLVEYALGLDPARPDSSPMPLTTDGRWLYFTYTLTDAATDATCFVEWSDTLAPGSWSTAGVDEHITSDNGTRRTIRAVIPAGSGGQRFVHLKVVK